MTSIRILGAAGTVTGSRFLVETGSLRGLVDAGFFQGPKELRLLEPSRRGPRPPGIPSSEVNITNLVDRLIILRETVAVVPPVAGLLFFTWL